MAPSGNPSRECARIFEERVNVHQRVFRRNHRLIKISRTCNQMNKQPFVEHTFWSSALLLDVEEPELATRSLDHSDFVGLGVVWLSSTLKNSWSVSRRHFSHIDLHTYTRRVSGMLAIPINCRQVVRLCDLSSRRRSMYFPFPRSRLRVSRIVRRKNRFSETRAAPRLGRELSPSRRITFCTPPHPIIAP